MLRLLVPLLALTAMPAQAAPNCNDRGPGLHIEFGFHIGSPYTAEEQEIFDKMHLRQNGVVARRTTRAANGCIQAWIPDGQGGTRIEYYDPRSFQLRLD